MKTLNKYFVNCIKVVALIFLVAVLNFVDVNAQSYPKLQLDNVKIEILSYDINNSISAGSKNLLCLLVNVKNNSANPIGSINDLIFVKTIPIYTSQQLKGKIQPGSEKEGIIIFLQEGKNNTINSSLKPKSINLEDYSQKTDIEDSKYNTEYQLLKCKLYLEGKNLGNYDATMESITNDLAEINTYNSELGIKYEVMGDFEGYKNNLDGQLSNYEKSYSLGNDEPAFLNKYFELTFGNGKKLYETADESNLALFEEAGKYFEKANEIGEKIQYINPYTLDSVRYSYVFCLYKVGNMTDETLEIIRKISENSILKPKAKYFEGNYFFKKKNYGEAEKCYKWAIENSKDDNLTKKATEQLNKCQEK